MPDPAHEASAILPHPDDLRAYVDYLRDLGVYDLLTQPGIASSDAAIASWAETHLRSAAAQTAGTQMVPRNVAATGSSAPSGPNRPTSPRPSTAQPAPRPPVLSPFDQAQQRRTGGTPASQHPPASSSSSRDNGPSIQITPLAGAPRTAVPASTAGDQRLSHIAANAAPSPESSFTPDMPAPTPFNQLAPLPATRVAPADKPAALQALRDYIGDCTRCPLAYAGRHSIVFADGGPNARLMFVGEGPGADEDEQGLPFVGKAGQLLNNMITAMGLQRADVYIANIVKCRPPKNRVPEPVEANTCSQFLLRQIDVVQPAVIVALGGTAATYLLGVKQSLTSLRGQWFDVRGAKCAVTYHPAFLLRDPRQKGEAWKDLQRVMTELKLKPAARS